MKEFRIEVGSKNREKSPVGNTVLNEISKDLKIDLKSVFIVRVFELNADISIEQVQKLCKELFSDPITEDFSVNSHFIEKFDRAVEVGFHPNVTDNIAITARRGIEDFLGRKLLETETVKSKKLYYFSGKISKEELQKIAEEKLFNPMIEEVKFLGD